MTSASRWQVIVAAVFVVVAASTCDSGKDREINARARASSTSAVSGSESTTSSTSTVSTSAPPTARPPADAFALGIEYTERGLGALYGSTGVRWAKTRLEAFEWGRIERGAPAGGVHRYDWSCTDGLVREYQRAGMTEIQSYLSTTSPWGNEPGRAPMPATRYLDDYRAFVRTLIERYDGDGADDMPGLVAPIRFWVVGGEWSGFWATGNADDYVTTLRATREAAREAAPDVQLGAIPFQLVDVFAGDPSRQEIARRLATPTPVGRKSTAGMLQILGHPELFDYVNVHSLGDYTELAPELAWFRDQMTARGYTKPIWVDDAFPMSFLANISWPTLYPVAAATKARVLQVIADGSEGTSAAATDWIRAQASSGIVKKAVTALGEGARGINLGNTEDWVHDSVVGLRRATTSLIGAAGLLGMADVRHDHGYDACDIRTPGAPRPALRTMALVARELGDGRFDAVTRVGTSAGVRGYRLQRGSRIVWVLWNDDRSLHLPGDPEPAVAYSLPVPGGQREVDVTVTPTTTAASDAAERRPVQGGKVELSLTSVPVFVETR